MPAVVIVIQGCMPVLHLYLHCSQPEAPPPTPHPDTRTPPPPWCHASAAHCLASIQRKAPVTRSAPKPTRVPHLVDPQKSCLPRQSPPRETKQPSPSLWTSASAPVHHPTAILTQLLRLGAINTDGRIRNGGGAIGRTVRNSLSPLSPAVTTMKFRFELVPHAGLQGSSTVLLGAFRPSSSLDARPIARTTTWTYLYPL